LAAIGSSDYVLSTQPQRRFAKADLQKPKSLEHVIYDEQVIYG
jgi:hypothetical protein